MLEAFRMVSRGRAKYCMSLAALESDDGVGGRSRCQSHNAPAVEAAVNHRSSQCCCASHHRALNSVFHELAEAVGIVQAVTRPVDCLPGRRHWRCFPAEQLDIGPAGLR